MSEPESTPILIGDFRIIKQIDAGGMRIVYLAKHEALDRLVALKGHRPISARSPSGRQAVQPFARMQF